MLTMKFSGVDSSTYEHPADDWRDRMLKELEVHVPRMDRVQATRQDFWRWFEGEADSLISGATVDRQQLLCARLDSLLAEAGILDRHQP